VETAVVLKHLPSGIEAEGSERRSLTENDAMALSRLRILLAVRVRTPVGEDQAPSPLWSGRTKSGRIVVSESHDDFPALLAEALDFVAACEFETKSAAERLGTTSSQLVRFLARVPESLKHVNEERARLGMSVLKG